MFLPYMRCLRPKNIFGREWPEPADLGGVNFGQNSPFLAQIHKICSMCRLGAHTDARSSEVKGLPHTPTHAEYHWVTPDSLRDTCTWSWSILTSVIFRPKSVSLRNSLRNGKFPILFKEKVPDFFVRGGQPKFFYKSFRYDLRLTRPKIYLHDVHT